MFGTTYTEPRAWVGCLGCYNSGRLEGDWLDYDTLNLYAESLAPCPKCGGDEFVCMDHEGTPRNLGECSVPEFLRWCEIVNEIGADNLEAFVAFCENEPGANLESLADRFGEALLGVYDSVQDFAEEVWGECFAHNVPAEIAPYFDLRAFARDLMLDYWDAPTDSGGVFIFHAHV